MPKQLVYLFSWDILMWPIRAFMCHLAWIGISILPQSDMKASAGLQRFPLNAVWFHSKHLLSKEAPNYHVWYSRLGGIQRRAWERELSGVRCEVQTWNSVRPSLCDLPPPAANPKSWKTLFITSHLSNTKSFCASKYFRVHITQSWKYQ